MTLTVAGPVRFERVRAGAVATPAAFAGAPEAGETGERAGLVLALAAHVGLFALLSLAWGAQAPRAWPKPQPIEVSLVKDVALEATAPPAPTPPAPSIAPDVGPPEEAAPAPPPAPAPEPVAKPEPVKPAPPKPAPAKPEPKAEPVPTPKPAPKPAPVPKPVPPKPAPKPVPAEKAPAAKPAPSKPAPPAKSAPAQRAAPAEKAAANPSRAAPAAHAAKPSRLAGLFPAIAAGAKADATAPRARGHRLGDDIVAGLSPDAPTRKAATAAPGAKPGPYPTASIVQAIARQIQPCADRQVNPGPGANRIVTTLDIRLNEDGTLAATPRSLHQSGINDENERYAQRVTDLGIAAFKGCTPLKLPAEYYATPSGGWSVIRYQWQLR